MLTQDRLKELLTYDPESGEFRWRVTRSTSKAGDLAGMVEKQGYRQITIDRKKYRAGRLAWLYQTGAFPEHEADHLNLVRSDDRFENLREATRAQNVANSASRRPKNRELPRGVCPEHSKYVARVQVNRVRTRFGLFDTPEEAGIAAAAARKVAFGEFAFVG